MAIRFATEKDVTTLTEYWRHFHASSVYSQLSFNERKLKETFSKIISDETKAYCFLVADNADGVAHGLIIGQMDSFYFSDDMVAKVILYWMHPDSRYTSSAVKLLMAFKQWAQNRKARQLILGVTSQEHLANTDKMFKKMGAQLVGGNYVFGIE